MLLGVLLVIGAAAGFWYVLQSVDERQSYVAAARTIERYEIVSASDFVPVDANVGSATAMTPPQAASLIGRWATGRIPAGTLVTPGLFEIPPLAGSADAGRVPLEGNVLIQQALPTGEAPHGQISTGETVVLLGREPTEADPNPRLGLIGILTLDYVEGSSAYFIVEPARALSIQALFERYGLATERRIWKINAGVTA